MAKITIGIPFYNCEKYLKSTINSVLNQSYHDFKLILLDDGSSDKSLTIAKSFRDKRICVLSDSSNKGLIFRLNQLINLTETEYFVRMDSDDLMFPDRISIQFSHLLNNSLIDVVGSDAISIDEYGKVIGYRKGLYEFSPYSIIKYGAFIHPTVMGKTSWFRKYMYLENFNRAEDLELWLRSCSNSVFECLAEPTLFYREGSINLNNYLTSAETLRKIFKKYKNYFRDDMDYFMALSKLYMKTSLYQVFSKIKMQKYLAAKRCQPLDSITYLKYSKLVEKINEFQA